MDVSVCLIVGECEWAKKSTDTVFWNRILLLFNDSIAVLCEMENEDKQKTMHKIQIEYNNQLNTKHENIVDF